MLLFRAELGLASFLIFFTCLSSSLNSDGLSLLALKAAIVSDPTGVLDKWSESDLVPCHWVGISCTRGRVTGVFLPNRGFTGYIPSELGALVNLRHLSLANNNFSKPIPSRLFNATALLSLDLSHNSLSGPLPTQVKALKYLVLLDLSSNLLIRSLLEELAKLENLDRSLNLSHNLFSSEVPTSYRKFSVMVSLDLHHNNLTGKIPYIGSLLNQGPTALSRNPSLYGFPLQTFCNISFRVQTLDTPTRSIRESLLPLTSSPF